MFKSIALSCLLAVSSTVAFAAEQDKERSPEMEAAIELLALMDLEQMMTGMQDQIEGMMRTQMQSLASCPAAQTAVDEFSRESSGLLTRYLGGDAFLAKVAEIYVEVFTLEEIQGVIEFYRSPVGRKLLDKMPELMHRSMEVSQEMLADVMPQIEAMSTRFADEVVAAQEACDDED